MPSGASAAALAGERASAVTSSPPAAQGFGQVAADEARRAGDQRLHIGRSYSRYVLYTLNVIFSSPAFIAGIVLQDPARFAPVDPALAGLGPDPVVQHGVHALAPVLGHHAEQQDARAADLPAS